MDRYRPLIDHSGEGVITLSTDGTCTSCNRRTLVLLGYTEAHEVVGTKKLHDLIHPEDRSRVLDRWNEAAAKDLPFASEFRIQRRDGSSTWVFGQGLAEKDEAGNVIGYMGTIANITHQRRVENALRARTQFLENVADQLPIGFAVMARDDEKITFANAKMQEIVGWPKGVLTYMPELMEKLILDPEQRKRIKARVEEDVAGGDPKRMQWEFTVTRGSGEDAVIVAHVIPTQEHDITIFTVQDITKHRRAEEELRQSEMCRTQLETELHCAAEVQKHLLPKDAPKLRNFELAALCIPAREVGGDFYDWHEMVPGVVTFTLGDVMGKGMAAAMLMATIRATLRAVSHHASPVKALRRAEQSLQHDLDSAESFVTMFLGRLHDRESRMTYVDCGHGFGFMRRSDGSVEELLPRGLPLGVPHVERYQEGSCTFEEGDVLILYSDGLIDADPNLDLDSQKIGARLSGAVSAREMIDRIASLVPSGVALPDDVTIFVLHRRAKA